ncbi:extracellular serine carboxypeptidase [Salix suchowensis]|nr:extracellular serine carboxypeptidase [Salix suchowensis]
MKILYPDLVFGAIASSGVTHAALSNWQYMDIIRRAADPTCMRNIEQSIRIIDTILNTRVFARPLKGLFGLADLDHDVDFVSTIESPLGSWQSKNWNPAIGSMRFDTFCAAVNAAPDSMANFTDLPFGARERLCFGTFDDSQYQAIGLDQDWRLWTFQVCTQWGTSLYAAKSLPRVYARLVDCRLDSTSGSQNATNHFEVTHFGLRVEDLQARKHFTVPPFPNVTAVNVLGDLAIAADRLAIIDGEDGVHHYDEYGLADMFAEPPEILKIHNEMIIFVQDWLADFKAPDKLLPPFCSFSNQIFRHPTAWGQMILLVTGAALSQRLQGFSGNQARRWATLAALLRLENYTRPANSCSVSGRVVGWYRCHLISPTVGSFLCEPVGQAHCITTSTSPLSADQPAGDGPRWRYT